ncbi:serine protease [Marilutibacter aestuarii]|uniref:serine protease n=1 Tax=Marilutibacter aestuarii TaxID=1706195 RepID=UPI001FEC5E64|nr:serine protease [Lysobacter aestuarii]
MKSNDMPVASPRRGVRVLAGTGLGAAATSALALALMGPAPTAHAQDAVITTTPRPAPIVVGVPRRSRIILRGRSGTASDGGSPSATTITTPDASFIKVHFDHFELPAGVVLEVSNPERTEVYQYRQGQLDAHTVDPDMGQNGISSFSAMSISGPTAVLRLVGEATEPWSSRHSVDISSYLEGYPEEMLPELQSEGLLSTSGDVGATSICGSDDKRPVACYVDSDPDAHDRSRPVGRMLSSGGSLCTVWRVGPDNRLFTNNHCISTQAGVSGAEFWFNYQQASCTNTATATVTKVTGNQMLRTDEALDYTLFTVNDFASLASFGYLGLDVGSLAVGDGLFIAQHPGGRKKELGVNDGSAACTIKTTNGSGTSGSPGSDIGYTCDTEGGSSGSPVISRASNKVIALHHLGGCNNQGAKISRIWPQVASYFNNQVPDGDDGGGTDPDPDPTPGSLQKGVPVNVSGAQGAETRYTITVPAGASNLGFTTSGGSGDADLYVRFGSAPTTSTYDCRPYRSGNAESCTFASPQAGTWHVMLRGYSAYSGLSLVADYATGGGSGAPCTGCTAYTGSLSGTGNSAVQPNGSYYQSGAGAQKGWLRGPAGTDFDLELYRWSGSAWSKVAQSTTATSEESISYNGTAGYYYWRMVSYSGSGSYTVWLDTP